MSVVIAGPIFTPMGLAMPRKNSTCAPSSCGRAHADPRHVRRQVVPALLALDVTRLRLLVGHEQAFVRREEVDRGDFVRCTAAAHAFEEVERVADRIRRSSGTASIERRMLHEPEVPVSRVMQVGEAAVAQRAHEIERERGALVAAQQQRRIGLARLRR